MADNRRKIFKLMFINLNHTKSVTIILVKNCLDACGLTCTGITIKKTVVRYFTLYKCFCVIYKFLFLNLISCKIIKHNLVQIIDWNKVRLSIILYDTERFVKSKHSYTIIFIELHNCIEECIYIFCRCQFIRKGTYFFTYIFIIHSLCLADCLII